MYLSLVTFDAVAMSDPLKWVRNAAADVCRDTVKRICESPKLKDGHSIVGRLTSGIFCKKMVSRFCGFK